MPPTSPVNPIQMRQAQTRVRVNLEKKEIRTGKECRSERKPRPPRTGGAVGRYEGKGKVEKIPLKEVFRDKEWVKKARETIQRDFARLIRVSNGVKLAACENCTYTYYLGSGNNQELVKACFKIRGWSRVMGTEGMKECNVVWTQGKIQRLFRTYEEVDSAMDSPKPLHPVSLSSSLKYPSKCTLTTPSRIVDLESLNHSLVTHSSSYLPLSPCTSFPPSALRTHNKLECNYHLTNKKNLLKSILLYSELMDIDPFLVIPVTFHIIDGIFDPEFAKFTDYYHKIASESEKTGLKNIWIVKPGENTNRGSGISICNSLEMVRNEVSSQSFCPETGHRRSFILQKYLETPLLLNKRKFDIRCYSLLTSINGVLQCYFYQEGYLRTSCKEFNLKDVTSKIIHLTNDAVQKYSEEYGKFEAGNKLSYSDLQRYFDIHFPGKNVFIDVVEKIREIVKMTVLATFPKLNAFNRKYSFELLGYDFMLDSDLKVWLIEVNTNPCLELSAPLLARIIPAMLDNTFRIAIDPYFPDGGKRQGLSVTGEVIPENKFELIFNSGVEGVVLMKQLGGRYVRLATCDVEGEGWEESEEESGVGSEDGC